MHFILSNLRQTKLLGQVIAQELIQHQEIYLLLEGQLAAGKTTLTKYIMQSLHVKSLVNSPTFVILNKYKTQNLNINHMDCYRLSSKENFELYLEEFSNSINIIEWPQLIKPFLQNKQIIEINLKLTDIDIRQCDLNFNFQLHPNTLANLKKLFE